MAGWEQVNSTTMQECAELPQSEDLETKVSLEEQNKLTELRIQMLIDKMEARLRRQGKLLGRLETITKKLVAVMGRFKMADQESRLRRALRGFESQTEKGYVEASQVRFALTNMGNKLSHEEIETFFQYLKIDERGLINMEDFIAILLLNH